MFGSFFFITQFPSLITHHLKHPTPFGTITHFSSLNIFYTICGPHTCHLVKAKLFCGPHHFLFSHFPSFTPVTLPKHKPEPSFNHNNKNNSNNNNKKKMRPIRRLIPPPPQPATTGRRRQQANTEPIRRRSSSINRYRTNARSSSTVSAGTPHQNPNRRVQGMGILKPIHVGILKPQIQIQTHPYLVMECGFKPKNYVMKNKKK